MENDGNPNNPQQEPTEAEVDEMIALTMEAADCLNEHAIEHTDDGWLATEALAEALGRAMGYGKLEAEDVQYMLERVEQARAWALQDPDAN